VNLVNPVKPAYSPASSALRPIEKDGYAGLADRRKGKPSAQRIPLETIEKILGLYQETYFDLNIRHFHEKLRDEHAIQ